ncbi:restriction endonuclease subunit S [Saccharopolyspora taberi]|uniref:Type I restriction modification DNA specificity domain-containing protein n=1 Tax=Saccharopolyspora taberi TaxID=60895 RepID=A0ABN3VM67_9PSEU
MNPTTAHWPVRPFAEVADYKAGKTPARANAAYWAKSENVVPWVSISDLEPFGVVMSTKEEANQLAFNEVFRGKLVPAGTLLMSFKLTIGRVATLGVPAVHNEAIISIYPRAGIDQRFLGYYLSKYDYGQLQDRQIKGNTLNKSKIDRIPVPVPPEEEQAAIADVLDRIRQGILLQDSIFSNLSKLKRAAMQQLFTQGLRGEVQKSTEIGPIPESWFVRRLDSHADVLSTRMSYTELQGMMPSDGETTVRVLGIKVSDMNTPGNEVELDDAALEVSVDIDVAKARCAPPGAIIFPKRGAAIATNKKRIAPTWTAFDPNVIGVVARRGLNQRFLFHWFQSFDLRTITDLGPTPQLNKKSLEPLLLPLPPSTDEQEEIAEVLDSLDRKINLHRRKREVLDQLFKSVLHKLMTGECAVKDLDISALSVAEGKVA